MNIKTIKTAAMALSALLCFTAGAVTDPTYKVTVKEGTEDAGNWTIDPAAATNTGVVAGTTITATYAGTKKVKSVKAKKNATVLAGALVNGATLEVMCNASNNTLMGGNFTYNDGVFTLNNKVGESPAFPVMKANASVSGTTITFVTGINGNNGYDHTVTLNTTDDTYTLTGGSLKGSVVSVKINGTQVLDKLTKN